MRASAGSSFPICRITSRERGDRREKVFFGDDDYALYRNLLREACRREGVAVQRAEAALHGARARFVPPRASLRPRLDPAKREHRAELPLQVDLTHSPRPR